MSIRVLIRSKGPARPLLLYFLDPFSGREVSKSAGTSDRGEAERAASRWEEELKTYRGEQNDGWEFFRVRFEDEHAAMLAEKTRSSLGTALNHFERLFKVANVSDVTPGMLSAFQAALHREKRPLTSIGNYLRHLQVALNWAASVGMLDKAPKVPMPKLGRRKFMRGRPITTVEYRILLKTCDKTRGEDAPAWRRFLELLWLSGLRLGEAMALSWDAPPVRADLESLPYPQLVFFSEGHKSRQDDAVPMTPELAAWLKKSRPKSRTGPVAPIPLATAPRASELIAEIGAAAGIVVDEHGKFASAHDFRRAFGTRWAAVVRPLTLQRLMRHASIETTLRYYVGLTSADAGAELWGSAASKMGTG